MPLEDLIALGYSVVHPEQHEDGWPAFAIVRKGSTAFAVREEEDQEAIVARETNRDALLVKLAQARDFFGGNYANWGTMTAQQKDAANRQAQRALANISRYLLNDLSSAGD